MLSKDYLPYRCSIQERLDQVLWTREVPESLIDPFINLLQDQPQRSSSRFRPYLYAHEEYMISNRTVIPVVKIYISVGILECGDPEQRHSSRFTLEAGYDTASSELV